MGDINNYPVTGAPRPEPALAHGAVPLRIELREMKKYKEAWYLYLLGLQSFYAVDVNSDLSYYEIAGIHGRPNREWGGVEGLAAEEKSSRWGGYCTHTSILFASWHRPYLALLEQILFGHIQKIADSYPPDSRARYQKAAATWRLPFWDWAKQPPAGETNLPTIIGSEKTVWVVTPTSNGKEVEIPNPLYSYKFTTLNPVPGDFIKLYDIVPFDEWKETIRYPDPNPRAVDAKSNDPEAFKAMANEYQSLRSAILLLMNDPNYKDYAAFTNHQWDPEEKGQGDASKYSSIEDIHNNIHALMGGNEGHMSELDYASYDPCFWLHHANIDRLFAIWQGINAESYHIDKPAGDGTFVMASTETYTNSTPLTPFYEPSGTKYWTSDGVRNTTNLNYAYPETQRWNFSSDKEYADDLHTKIQSLYGSSIADLLAGQIPKPNIPAAGSKPSAPTTSAPGPITAIKGAISAITPIKGAPVAQHPLAGKAWCGKKGASITSVITALTGSNSPFGAVLGAMTGVNVVPTTPTASVPKKNPVPSPAQSSKPAPRGYTEYIANIKVLKHALNQTFRVHVFLGEFDVNCDSWHTDPTLAGTVVVFGKDPGETACEKCVQDATDEVNVTGTVPLTNGILEIFKAANNTTLRSLLKEDVLPWLKTNLHWRVTLADGTERNREQVEGLKVSVVTTEISCPEGGLPTYSGVYTAHPEVTEGRPAGFCSDDEH